MLAKLPIQILNMMRFGRQAVTTRQNGPLMLPTTTKAVKGIVLVVVVAASFATVPAKKRQFLLFCLISTFRINI